MKKLAKLFIALAFSIILAFGVTACGTGGGADNVGGSSGYTNGSGYVGSSTNTSNSKVVRYDLSSIKCSNLTVAHYDYNYIKFNYGNNTYYLENKSKQNGIVTKQSGTFSVTGDAVTITNSDIPSQNYFLYPNETLTFSGSKFKIEAYIAEYGGDCYFIYSK